MHYYAITGSLEGEPFEGIYRTDSTKNLEHLFTEDVFNRLADEQGCSVDEIYNAYSAPHIESIVRCKTRPEFY